jgi:photosystem II stability/assembly factor-like uncharacterized protein
MRFYKRSVRPGVSTIALVLIVLTVMTGTTGAVSVTPSEHSGGCDDEVIYAAVLSTRKHQLAGDNPTVGVFYSADGGERWQHTGWRIGRTFAVMAVPGGCGDTLVTASGNGVMRTIDGGGFWRIATGWQVTEVQDVTMSPVDPRVIYASTPYGIFYSDTLGERWEERSEGLSSRFVAAVRIARLHAERVFAGTESGLYISHDAGRTWRASGIDTPVRSIRQSPIDPNRWAAALQDRGIAISDDGGQTWRHGTGAGEDASIYEVEFDPWNEDVLYAGGWQTGVLHSTDAGRTWNVLGVGLEGVGMNVHALAISRKHPGYMFAGTMGDGMYRSVDGGMNWHPLVPDIFEASQVWDLYIEGEQ